MKKGNFWLGKIGTILILISFTLLILIFWPVTKEEFKYAVRKVSTSIKDKPEFFNLTPPNTDFAIVIPKIGAVAPVIANVDPDNKDVYLAALKKGVAHALRTSFPGRGGNIFLFAHSTDLFTNISRFNAIFYLIGKLKPGDEIFIWYQTEKFVYSVKEIKIVDSKAVNYMGKIGTNETLTLQTCYPPGTTLKRLVVVAERK